MSWHLPDCDLPRSFPARDRYRRGGPSNRSHAMNLLAYLAAMTVPFILFGLGWAVLLMNERAERQRKMIGEAAAELAPEPEIAAMAAY